MYKRQTVGFGIIGFLDDYIKIILHRSEGLTPGQKMFGQFLVTGVFIFYYYNLTGGDMAMLIPFWPGHYLHLGWLAIPVAFLAIIGTVNGANFTDGLDGLASSVTVLIAVFFTVVAVGTGSGLHPIKMCIRDRRYCGRTRTRRMRRRTAWNRPSRRWCSILNWMSQNFGPP